MIARFFYFLAPLLYTTKKDNNAEVWKFNLLFFFFSFYYSKCTYELSKRVGQGQNVHTGLRNESSDNRFFFVLLSRDFYRATSRHWIILLSPHFSAFASLELFQGIESFQFLLASLFSQVSYSSDFSLRLSREQSGAKPVPRLA